MDENKFEEYTNQDEIIENERISMEYQVKNEEEEVAFKRYQKKFVYKSCVIQSSLYGIVALLFLQQAVLEPSRAMSWSLMSVCIAMIFVTWHNPYKTRKNLLNVLKVVENNKYKFTLYDTYFSIETTYFEKNEIEYDENGDEIEDEEIVPNKINLDDKNLYAIETDEMFIIFLKSETIYVLPKRCADSLFISTLTEVLSTSLHDRYKID